jgi:hypothetical protein
MEGTYVAFNVKFFGGAKGRVGLVFLEGDDEVGVVAAHAGLGEGLESEEDWDEDEGVHCGMFEKVCDSDATINGDDVLSSWRFEGTSYTRLCVHVLARVLVPLIPKK